MSKNKILNQFLKIILAVVISFSVCWVINLFSSMIANDYLIKNNWVKWTLYDGFANNCFLIFACLMALYVLNSKNEKNVFIQIIYFSVLFLIFDCALDLYDHYQRFYGSTNANGSYSYDIFKKELSSRINIFHFTLYQYLSFMVHNFCCLLAIAIIVILSRNIENRIFKDRSSISAF